MVQDYTNKFYVNTALRFTSFRDRRYRKAVETEMFKAHIQDNWHIVHVDSVVDRPGSVVPGQKRIEANVQVGPFELKNILVEAVYHQQAEDGRWTPVVVKLEHVGVKDGYLNVYAGLVPDYMAHGPHYFVRVRPVHENFGKNFEVPNIARS
jgi:starch phosphorylase